MIGDSSRGVISGTSLRATSLRRMWFRSGGQLLCACSFFLFNRLSTRWRLVQYTKLPWQCLILQAYNTAISSDFWGHEPTFTLDSHLVIGWLQNTTVFGLEFLCFFVWVSVAAVDFCLWKKIFKERRSKREEEPQWSVPEEPHVNHQHQTYQYPSTKGGWPPALPILVSRAFSPLQICNPKFARCPVTT